MAVRDIRNPIEWSWDQLTTANRSAAAALRAVRRAHPAETAPPEVRRIAPGALREVLAKGFADFQALRTDVVFLCVAYPVIGLVLARMALGSDLLPLLFPLASGFALVGPFAAVGLYEMSRHREQGRAAGWGSAFGVVRSPAFGAILLLGLVLVAIFLLWLAAAWGIYALTLGPEPPATPGAFLRDVLTTAPGWAMIAIGIAAGFLFALLAMTISVVSFPLLLDREVALGTAIRTSVRAVRANPGTMAAWGLIVAGGLVLGSLPLLVGLAVVLPVLGHATWHLYRKLVAG
ncbi:MAG: DUF2189 domain-containing protein [Dongiaceae bacterium]